MEEDINETRNKLEKSRTKILENSRKLNEELDRLRLEEVKKVANEIVNVFPREVSNETFEQIVAVVAKYQKKHEDAIKNFLDMDRQKQIIELENTSIDDPDWWTKASVAKMHGIKIPGMEMEDVIERNGHKTKKQD